MRGSGQIAAGLAPTAKLLPRSFFERDPVVVSRELLGKIVVRRSAGGAILAGRIVETEAYLGVDDAAAHSYAGETERNRVLFGPAGHAYVYFIYGMYYCLNFSCMKRGEAGCTLIRALEPIAGTEEMLRNRRLGERELTPALVRSVCSGPGKLCQALGITRERDNGKDVCARESDLRVVEDGNMVGRVNATPRVGISKAAERPLRFCVAGSEFLSRREAGVRVGRK